LGKKLSVLAATGGGWAIMKHIPSTQVISDQDKRELDAIVDTWIKDLIRIHFGQDMEDEKKDKQ
jgi:hypothetical protein